MPDVKNCPILEVTGDNVPCGRCWFYLPDGKTCPRHGDVSAAVELYKKTFKLTLESKRGQIGQAMTHTPPTNEQLKEWRRLADGTDMISAVGEYTPPEFTVLLDEVESLRAQGDALLAALRAAKATFYVLKQLDLGAFYVKECEERWNQASAAIVAAEGKE